VSGLLRLLRSAAFARAILVYLAVLCGVAAWLPWVRAAERAPAPAWAAAVGLDHPFSSAWLLAGVAALLASTLACTWGRRARIAALARGELSAGALALPGGGRDPAAFLRARGFRGSGEVLHRNRFALWGGLVLHWGLIALIGGVGVQQALHDGASFQLAVGEERRLSEAGAVFGRERGVLAPEAPPDLAVALVEFDPFRHEPGYAPDRHSVLELRAAGAPAVTAALDRADGVRAGGVTVYQAIPAGLAAIVEVAGRGRRVLHLATQGERTAAAEVAGPGGPARLVVETERSLGDRMGTGLLSARVEHGGRAIPIAPGEPFPLGGEPARIVGWARWSGFTYARSPGMAAVVAGFGLVLLGAALLAVPAGVARLPARGGGEARVWAGRGAEALLAEWREEA